MFLVSGLRRVELRSTRHSKGHLRHRFLGGRHGAAGLLSEEAMTSSHRRRRRADLTRSRSEPRRNFPIYRFSLYTWFPTIYYYPVENIKMQKNVTIASSFSQIALS